LLVGLPVLGLLGILEAGRGIAAPPAISGDWTVDFGASGACGVGRWRQPALSISQSGTDAIITINDGRTTAFEATVNGGMLTGARLSATISGKPGARVLEGKLNLDGCSPVAFRAVRQVASKKRGE
jgi:hypothetical protein